MDERLEQVGTVLSAAADFGWAGSAGLLVLTVAFAIKTSGPELREWVALRRQQCPCCRQPVESHAPRRPVKPKSIAQEIRTAPATDSRPVAHDVVQGAPLRTELLLPGPEL